MIGRASAASRAAGSARPSSGTASRSRCAEGQTVRAVHEGTVAYADQFTGYGNLVIVEHGDGAYSLYGYLDVDRGRQGGPRGGRRRRSARPGRNPGGNPALYFELRVDGKPVDPLQWLKR